MKKLFTAMSMNTQRALIKLPESVLDKIPRVDGEMEIILTIQGVDVDIEQLFDGIWDDVDVYVEAKAKEMIKYNAASLDIAVGELYNTVSSAIDTFKAELRNWTPR